MESDDSMMSATKMGKSPSSITINFFCPNHLYLKEVVEDIRIVDDWGELIFQNLFQ